MNKRLRKLRSLFLFFLKLFQRKKYVKYFYKYKKNNREKCAKNQTFIYFIAV